MKKLFLVPALIILLALVMPATAFADTGEYEILDYKVSLTPFSDGTVSMEYYQEWKVTSGHIPWITIGMPNNDYEILETGGAIAKISKETGDFTGVRIDLDKDYMPGETFKVRFTAKENKLFSADDEAYKMEFIPGWYDRAFIGNLEISVKFFAPLENVELKPEPSSIDGESGVATWKKTELGKGEKLEISFSISKEAFPEEIPEDNLKAGLSPAAIVIIVIIAVILLAGLCFALYAASDGDGYSGGIFYSGGGSGRSGSGGGGFGGRSSSCVSSFSCACACACAGGGGAGCSRKDEIYEYGVRLRQERGEHGEKRGVNFASGRLVIDAENSGSGRLVIKEER